VPSEISQFSSLPHLCAGVITLGARILQSGDEVVLHGMELLLNVRPLRQLALDVLLQGVSQVQEDTYVLTGTG
jgi:hypothetical protein